MEEKELRHSKHTLINNSKEKDVQEQIRRLENENCDLRTELDDLQIICKYLKKENIELVELLYEARKYIKENRL